VALFAFLGGFVIFASSTSRFAPQPGVAADGIVVLTGGVHRLSEAARLLSEGRGKRLLISGANRIASAEDLLRSSQMEAALFHRSVDIGYDAHDHRRQRRRDQRVGEGERLFHADHRHLELPHATHPDGARPDHAERLAHSLSGGVAQFPHRALVDARPPPLGCCSSSM